MAEAEAAEGGKKKGGFIKWVILAVLLLALLGGGYVAYLKFFAAPPPAQETAEAPAEKPAEKPKASGHGAPEKPAEKKKEESGGHGGGGGGHGGKSAPKEGESKGNGLVTLPPFVVNLSDPSSKRFLRLSVDVEVVDEATGAAITANMPKVKDSMIMLLSSKSSADLAGMEGKILLRKEIVERLNQILGGPKVTRVYITDIVIQ